MRGVVIYSKDNIRFGECEDSRILNPSDAVVRTVVTYVCGPDLQHYRGINEVLGPTSIDHEYVGMVEEVGDAVRDTKPGEFVVDGFRTSDDICPVRRKDARVNCQNGTGHDGCQAERICVPNADGTLVTIPGEVNRDLVSSLLTLSDVACTGWHDVVSVFAGPGRNIIVVGNGAVRLYVVLAARQLGSEQMVAVSSRIDKQEIARKFGANIIASECGEEGSALVRGLTGGIDTDGVVRAARAASARDQTAPYVCPGGMIGVVGVPHSGLKDDGLFFRNVGMQGGIVLVRRYLDQLIQLVVDRKISPGRVFGLQFSLTNVAEAYAAMDERRVTKMFLWP